MKRPAYGHGKLMQMGNALKFTAHQMEKEAIKYHQLVGWTCTLRRGEGETVIVIGAGQHSTDSFIVTQWRKKTIAEGVVSLFRKEAE